jgi:hypothetical protein
MARLSASQFKKWKMKLTKEEIIKLEYRLIEAIKTSDIDFIENKLSLDKQPMYDNNPVKIYRDKKPYNLNHPLQHLYLYEIF